MSESAILKISSSKGSCLGTGFIIDKDDGGVFVATCGHVIGICGEKTLLVDEQKAKVVRNHYNDGIDIAILYLPKLKTEPLLVEYDTESKDVAVQGFTSFGKDIKKEKMENIKAKYKIELKNEKRKVEIVRLTPKEKITRGYSGSPVISQITGKVVGMVIVEAREQNTNYAISSKHILEVYNFSSSIQKKDKEEILLKLKNKMQEIIKDDNTDELVKKNARIIYSALKYPWIGIPTILFLICIFLYSIYNVPFVSKYFDSNGLEKKTEVKENKLSMDKELNKIKISLSGEVKNRKRP